MDPRVERIALAQLAATCGDICISIPELIAALEPKVVPVMGVNAMGAATTTALNKGDGDAN